MAMNMSTLMISGPTTGTNLSPFSWDAFDTVSHVGLPTVYDYNWVLMKPRLLETSRPPTDEFDSASGSIDL